MVINGNGNSLIAGIVGKLGLLGIVRTPKISLIRAGTHDLVQVSKTSRKHPLMTRRSHRRRR